MLFEVDAIHKACAELDPNFKPAITYIVCQKRHHTRLYPVDKQNQDRSGNIQAGTVVDQGITSTVDFDFYLNSHQGIQGTNKPAKYHVLVDENKPQFTPDQLQRLTFNLCHLYARCTRSVSIPAPTYYAHLATDRARAHLASDKYQFDSSDGASSVAGAGAGPGPRQDIASILKDVSPHDMTKNRMYWI